MEREKQNSGKKSTGEKRPKGDLNMAVRMLIIQVFMCTYPQGKMNCPRKYL
jgi:hypothetical protein